MTISFAEMQQIMEMLFGQPPIPISQQLERWHPDLLGASPSSYGTACMSRVTADLRSLLSSSHPGADVFPDENDPTQLDLLLRGQRDTPYEGGFFRFSVRVTPQYPLEPPRVVLRTTGGGRVRFNPNYYENGCVCLSILGTWHGEPWDKSYTLINVLHSLQYQFNELPWNNEPGFQQDFPVEMKQLYSDFLAHETLRVAVCEQLGSHTDAAAAAAYLPPSMKRCAARHFVHDFDTYIARCDSLAQRLDGRPMMNPYRPVARNVPFKFANIRRQLEQLREPLQQLIAAPDDDDDKPGDA